MPPLAPHPETSREEVPPLPATEPEIVSVPEAGQRYDGGKDAWATLIGAWLVQFCTYGYVSAFGIYQDYYTKDFLSLHSPSAISWIGSVQLFLQYAPGLLVGHAFDAGYFHHVVALGTFLQIFSMFMLSLAHRNQYYQVFLAQGVGMGFGQSMLFIPSLTIIGHHFKARRALATGIAVSGASVGGVVWPILIHRLRLETSFANMIRLTGALSFVMLLVSNILMKTRTQPARLIGLGNLPKPKIGVVFSDAAYVVSVISAFCINLGIFFPYFYLQLFATNLGVDEARAFYCITVLNGGSALGRLLPSFLADRAGAYNMLLVSLSITCGLAFAMFGLKDFSGVIAFAMCYGFWSGAYVSLIPCLLAQLSISPREQGLVDHRGTEVL
ncbi:hypothetical protein D9613_011747 [Agrocybe pediades]|uniref:Major facilitator superfamily (MFS) profile domain-containing protein n=1 Tax=Agrocybe pediades TaxID=84607 RepID=A0A8H4VM15_9AGAR|nr:hypothetical protein D9613_011747 [Agrocybe pediades]